MRSNLIGDIVWLCVETLSLEVRPGAWTFTALFSPMSSLWVTWEERTPSELWQLLHHGHLEFHCHTMELSLTSKGRISTWIPGLDYSMGVKLLEKSKIPKLNEFFNVCNIYLPITFKYLDKVYNLMSFYIQIYPCAQHQSIYTENITLKDLFSACIISLPHLFLPGDHWVSVCHYRLSGIF